MTLSVAEQCSDNLQWTLLAIGAAGTVVIAANVSGATAAGGGAYTGDDFTIYRVRVTTAGVSGAAKVTVTDMLQSDTPGGTTTVTSASAFSLGALGITLTLTWTGTLEADDLFYVKSGGGSVTPEQAFTVDTTWVTRTVRMPAQTRTSGPEIYVYEPDQDKDPGGTATDVWLEYLIQGWTTAEPKEITDTAFETSEQSISALVKDMEMALAADVTRGGNANLTEVRGIENHVAESLGTVAGAGLAVFVRTRHRRADPSTTI